MKSFKQYVEGGRIVFSPAQQKAMDKSTNAMNSDLKKKLKAGKISIRWSQSRGGHAIFVKGRMEGPLFDSEDDAEEYLKKLGIRV
jgi:hypothetical protein